MTPFDTPEFAALKREWDARLAASGFVDAEVQSLSGYDTRLVHEYERGMPREQYYRLAGWWLNDKVWPSRRLRRVWELHAEGATFRSRPAALQPMERTHRFRELAKLARREGRRMVKHYVGRVT